jgi:lipopolysaccharide transport system ATP-binding protein
MSDIAIKVENLGKMYRIGAEEQRPDGLWDATKQAVLSPFDYLRRITRPPTEEETLWALKDVSFQVERGEVVGIIGRNGAGKSTLLKVLSRITEPTEGRAVINGRVGSLLEVGTGFHPELTGRENIYLNGAILGMTKDEIDRKFDEIVDFSGVEKFIDTPVKRYSSGMRVRLGFSVAAHLDPEILLIDEVLAVGDLAFQKKCLSKMDDVAQAERTILFVSHNMRSVRSLCPRSILVHKGEVVADGSSDRVTAKYNDLLRDMSFEVDTATDDHRHRRGSGAVRLGDIRVEDALGQERHSFKMGEAVRFILSYKVMEPVDELFASFALRSGKSYECVTTSAKHLVSKNGLRKGQTDEVVIEIPCLEIRPGEYPLYFWLGDRFGRPYDVVDGLTMPLIVGTDLSYEELGYRPSKPAGFFDIESRLIE